MKIRVEWEHTPESGWDLEQWVADLNGARLTVCELAGTVSPEGNRQFAWGNNLTGAFHNAGLADTLEAAMLDAINSVTERGNK